MRWILVSTAGVGHHVEVALVGLCDDEVVHNPALLIGEEGQGTLGTMKKHSQML